MNKMRYDEIEKYSALVIGEMISYKFDRNYEIIKNFTVENIIRVFIFEIGWNKLVEFELLVEWNIWVIHVLFLVKMSIDRGVIGGGLRVQSLLMIIMNDESRDTTRFAIRDWNSPRAYHRQHQFIRSRR